MNKALKPACPLGRIKELSFGMFTVYSLLLDVFYKICLQLVTGGILLDKTAFGDQEGLQIHENGESSIQSPIKLILSPKSFTTKTSIVNIISNMF